MRRPSFEIDIGESVFEPPMSRSDFPTSVAACVNTLDEPRRSELNMRRLPSGDQSGNRSSPGSTVIRVSVSRWRSHIQISLS